MTVARIAQPHSPPLAIASPRTIKKSKVEQLRVGSCIDEVSSFSSAKKESALYTFVRVMSLQGVTRGTIQHRFDLQVTRMNGLCALFQCTSAIRGLFHVADGSTLMEASRQQGTGGRCIDPAIWAHNQLVVIQVQDVRTALVTTLRVSWVGARTMR